MAVPRSKLVTAILYMSLALVSFSFVAIAGREASRGVTTIELMYLRSLIGMGILLAVLWWKGWGLASLRSERAGLHVMRSVVHFGAQYSWLYALTLIPLAELFALEFTSPLWVALLAPFFLKERLTLVRVIAAMLGFGGALLVVQPGLMSGTFALKLSAGSIFAILSAIGFACSMIATKFLTRTEPVFRILLYMHALQTVIALVLLPNGLPWPTADTMVWVMVVAVGGLSAHFGLAMAFQNADAIIVAPLDFLRLPVIALVGWLLYAEPLSASLAAGASVVVLANAFNIWGERRRVAAVTV